MLSKEFADKLTTVACEQLMEGLEAKKKRMDTIVEINDLYNNKTIELEDDVVNIPFPILAGHVDLIYSKIDNPPTLEFKVPNKASLSAKVKAAWMQESSSTRAGWRRKDRAEKKFATLCGRAVAKVYASSVNNKYQSHYDVVDIYSFVADPTRGFLEDGNYHGETDIFKTEAALKLGVDAGIYDKAQVELLRSDDTMREGNSIVVKNKFDRLKALGVDVESTSFAGQKGSNMTEWVMRYEGKWYYLLFEPAKKVWVRAEELKDVFESGKTPYVSWATHYDEFCFWTKGPADDVYPIAEAVRLILNTALENEKRRSRPMRIAESGAFVDINELQDYVPDNVILTTPGKKPNIVTVETPEITTTINLAEFLDGLIQRKSGVAEPGISESDPKVGVFYGKLQQEADRIGTINKEYSESYAHKGYRFFWGLKEHLTRSKQVEMLGKSGIKLQELSKFDFKDVDDVDDVVVSGGSEEAELTAVDAERKAKTLAELSAAYAGDMNSQWVIRNRLKLAGYEDDEIAEALDKESSNNREIIEEADQAIQDIMLGHTPDLNMGADTAFAERIVDYVRNELNYVKLDKNGKEIGIDEKTKEKSDRLLAYLDAHQRIITENMVRKQRKLEIAAMAGPQPEAGGGAGGLSAGGGPTKADQMADLARPFEGAVQGTPQGTAKASRGIAKALAG